MKVIKQSHEILSITKDILNNIEIAGRTCYKSEDKISPGTSKKFTKALIDRGHHAMIEFGDITVKFITNRGVTHELVRHRLCSFAQESTRYVKYLGNMEFILPVWWDEWNTISRDIWTNQMISAEIAYKELLDNGSLAQVAREVLPNSLKTEIVVKANVREWRHIFTLRCSSKAHPQMRFLMLDCLSDLKSIVPIIFDDIPVD